MQLDSFTLMVSAGAVVFVLGLLMLFFWTQDRRSAWMVWFCAPYFFGALAAYFYSRDGGQAVVLAMGIGTTCLMLAFGFVWQALRVFERRRPILWPVFLPAAIWQILAVTSLFQSSLALRVVVSSLPLSGFFALAAWELWRGRSEVLPSRRPAIAVLVSAALLFGLRVPLIGVLPYPFGGLALGPISLGIFAIVLFVHVAFLTVLMISLGKERREALQRSYALQDPLTGLLNRRAFAAMLERPRGRGENSRLAILVLDLDGFKTVNDRFGHGVGDRVLASFAKVAERNVRASDQLYRMGGEEFCFVLPEAGRAQGIEIAERVRRAFAATAIEVDGIEVASTVSIGVAVAEHSHADLQSLLAAADAAAYEAKARGRNRVVLAEPGSTRPPDLAILRPAT